MLRLIPFKTFLKISGALNKHLLKLKETIMSRNYISNYIMFEIPFINMLRKVTSVGSSRTRISFGIFSSH